MSAPVKLELLGEVNEVGSFDGKPRVGLLVANALATARKARSKNPGALVRPEVLGELELTREQARWFGALLYRRVRITIEDGGPSSVDEQAARDELAAEFDAEGRK